MSLQPIGAIDLPRHPAGGFDHGDVHLPTGRVFVAHTANGTVEVLDGEQCRHLSTIPGCPEASGVLCTDRGLVFAAARGGGRVLVIDALAAAVVREVMVGPKPNGLAWDGRRRHLLVADVEDLRARLIDPGNGACLAAVVLPGRPRWAAYDAAADRFLINIREPACVILLSADSGEAAGRWPVSSPGPHGLDLDLDTARAFVACDDGMVVALDLAGGHQVGRGPIAGEPDAVWYNPAAARLYVAIGRPGLVDVLDIRSMELLERIVTEEGAHTTAFDRLRQRLYVFLPRSGCASVYAER